ncbi:translocation/assembly module TamB domain-containing protein [Alkalilimnicola sp. S0819]|uniref:autotransporter assembly complex protein TamB n=1 Tax=Alkalilimnicola sp. S0819 TaxID=2613922 RepID=UPI001262A497|nr:translocation/assembly module TamB domain-containing protein [Alkalilimnicola sp. S0819]KAB7623715.1 translocation/assembly module TamB [Alkalilimnicola sp. S0819]MPQ16844.1 hypothetical protein [Alkalilimnicola sp. S0819]
MKHWVRNTVLVLLLGIGLALGWLLGTTSGARWLVGQAQALEPRLAVTVVDGDLWSGLEVRQLRWQDEALAVSLRQALLRWRLSCLGSWRVCVDHLEAEGLRVTLHGTDEPAKTAEQPMAPLDLPVEITLRGLVLSDSTVQLDDTRLAVHRLQGAAQLRGSELDLRRLDIDGLLLTLPPPSEQGSPATGPDSPATAIELPKVELPLSVRVRDFSLRQAELRRGEQRWPLQSLQLAGSLRRQGELALDELALRLPQGEASAAGHITLRGDYPLDLSLALQAAEPIAGQPVKVRAELNGSVARLQAQLSTQGLAVAELRARLQPLQPALPFELTLRAEQLAWPPTEPELTLRQLQLSARGQLDDYHYEGTAQLLQQRLGEAGISLTGSGDLQTLAVAPLRVSALQGELTLQADLDWSEQLRWRSRLQARGLNPGALHPEWQGELGGQLRVDGELAPRGLALQARIERLEGRLGEYPLSMRGAVRKSADGPWRLQGLRLDSGDNRLALTGTVAESALALRAELAMNELAALLPGARGSLRGSVEVRGELQEPDLSLDLHSDGLRYDTVQLGESRLSGELRALGQEPSELDWRLNGLRVAEQALGRVQGSLRGSREEHRLALAMSGGSFGGDVDLRGALDLPAWRGTLESAQLFAPEQRWQLDQPVNLAWEPEAGVAVSAHCWNHRQASLCLQEPLQLTAAGEEQLRLRLADYRLEWLRPWLPEALGARGALNAVLSMSWGGDEPPRLALEAASDDGKLVLRPLDDEPPLELPWQRVALDAGLEDQRLRTRLSLESDTLGQGQAAVAITLGEGPRPLEGEVDLSGLRLAPLRAVLPRLRRLEGRLSARGELAGTLSQPVFNGRLALNDGQLEAAALPMKPRDIQLRVDVTGRQARLEGSFAAGDGRASLKGDADWREADWQLALGLEGEGLEVADPPLYRLMLAPDLQLRAVPGRLDLTGTLHVPRGEIVLDDLPSQAVGLSSDVVIVEGKPDVAPPKPTAEGDTAEPVPGWEIHSEVEITLGEQVSLEGYGLSGRLEGNLQLRELTGAAPAASGEIRIVDGRYEAYGQKLKIRRGQLIFAGPLTEPALNVEAVRETPEALAGLRVEGQAEDPRVSLFSEPPMPQEEILSYLIRGRGLGAGGDAGGSLLAQAALSLGIYGGKGFATQVAEQLGVEDFAVGTEGQGDDAQLVFSGAISPRLFLSYGVGVFKPENTLTLRYLLGRSVYLEAVSGLENALDIFYEFEF